MQFDLYGSKSAGIEAIRLDIEHALELEFEARSSSYFGEYFSYERTGERISLKPNKEALDEGELIEDDFPEYRLLLYVTGSPRGDEIRKRLSGVPSLSFLRRDER